MKLIDGLPEEAVPIGAKTAELLEDEPVLTGNGAKMVPLPVSLAGTV